MKRELAAAMLLCLLLVPIAASSSADAAESWGIMVTPEAVKTGSNATILVTGPADSFVTMSVVNSANVTAWESFVIIGTQGMSSATFSVPFDASAGTYYAVAAVGGAEVARSSFGVEFDSDSYWEEKLREASERLDALAVSNQVLARTNADLRERTEMVMWFSFMAMAAGAFAWVLTCWKGKDLLKALLARAARGNGVRGRVAAALNFWIAEGVQGQVNLEFQNPGLATKREELRAMADGTKEKGKPILYLQTERDPEIYATYELNPVEPWRVIRRQMPPKKESEKETVMTKVKSAARKAVKRKGKSKRKKASASSAKAEGEKEVSS